MLAFVMVFTGMGIGSWGVDAADAATICYTVNEVIGITSADIPEGATDISAALPIAGEGTIVGTYKGQNLYYIGLDEKNDEVKVKNVSVSYKQGGKKVYFTTYKTIASKDLEVGQSTSDIKDFCCV